VDVAQGLSSALARLGVAGVVGDPLGDLEVWAEHDTVLARLLGDCQGRLGPSLGASRIGRRLRLSDQPGHEVTPRKVSDIDGLETILGAIGLAPMHTTWDIDLDLDLDAPLDRELQLGGLPSRAPSSLDPSLAEIHPLLLVGPGVVRSGYVDALRRAAGRLGLGVLNTYGAKGVLEWDDPAHHGTIGIQEGDRRLSGLDAAQLVVASGLDPLELDVSDLAFVLDVPPAELEALAARWPEPTAPPPPPELYRVLSGDLAPHYESDSVPLHPARAANDLAGSLPPGALIAADGGAVGAWVARCLPTREPGSVVVPATSVPGVSVALAAVAERQGRPALAITDAPNCDLVVELLSRSSAAGTDLRVMSWGAEGELAQAEDHRRGLDALWASPGARCVPVPVELSAAGLESGGEICAWTS